MRGFTLDKVKGGKLLHTSGAGRSKRIVGAISATVMSFGLWGGIGIASAHDLVVESTPENGSVVSEPIDEISMTFSGRPKEGFNSVALSRNGEVLFSDEPELDGRVLSIDVPDDVEWQPGDYTVGYQITSSDGHATRGSVDFEFAGENAAGSTANSAQESDTEEESENGIPSWLFGVAGIVVVVGALVMAIAKWRNMS